MSTNTRLRVIAVGAGAHYRNAHHRAMLADPARFELVAIVDPYGGQDLAKALDLPHFERFEEAFAQVEADLAIVATPPAHHRAPTVAALRAGLDVLCEKPPAITVEDAVAIHAAAEDTGGTVMYGLKYAFQTPAVPDFLKGGESGRFLFGRAYWTRSHGIPPWDAATVRTQHGGGAFIDLGLHPLSAALAALGFPKVASVEMRAYGFRGSQLRMLTGEQLDVEHEVKGRLEFATGELLEFEVSWQRNDEPAERVGFELTFELDTLHVPLATTQPVPPIPVVYSHRGGVYRRTELLEPASLTEHPTYSAQLQRLYEIRQGTGTAPVDAARGVELMRIIAAAYASARQGGQPVRLGTSLAG